MSVQVSIIIVNYNTEILLKNCIQSIIDKTINICYEIIVVDNASKIDSLNEVAALFPIVKFLMSDQNLGFGSANNIGVEMSQGKYLFFLNPDTILINDVVQIFYEYMELNHKVGICGGNLFNLKREPILSYHLIDFYKREWMILFNKIRTIGFNRSDAPMEVRAIMGADLFISKDLFVNVGKYDPLFFMYFEEVDLCDRVRSSGKKVMCIPNANIIHLEGASAENKSIELKKWSYQEHWYSKWIYLNKKNGFLLTSSLHHANILKCQLGKLFYTIKKNKTKMMYWELKEDVIKKTYTRYKCKIYQK